VNNYIRANQRYRLGAAGEGSVTLLGDRTELEKYFSAGSLTLIPAIEGQDGTATVRQHSRRRYPGGPGATVAGHDRRVSGLKAYGGGGALPGERFYCERPTGEGPLRRSNAQAFSYLGTWAELKRRARAARVGTTFTLRNKSGKAIEIAPPAAPG
jgi:hypothetical protein